MDYSDPANTSDLTQLFEQAQELITDLEDYDSAIEIFSQILSSNPSFQPAYKSRGICYYSTARNIAAKSDLEVAVRLDATDHDALFWLGMVIHELGMERTIAAETRSGWREAVGGVQYDYRVQLLAIQQLDQAIHLNADYSYVYNRALMRELVGQYEPARSDFEDILNRSDLEWPAYREAALIGRARTFLGEEQERRARQDLEQYNQIQAQNGRPFAKINVEDLVRKYRKFRRKSGSQS
jgi:lipoprotein NlpI